MAFQSNRKEKKHKQHRVVNKMANVEVEEIEMEIKNQLKCVCRNWKAKDKSFYVMSETSFIVNSSLYLKWSNRN